MSKKKPNNPDGKKGNPQHQQLQNEVFHQFQQEVTHEGKGQLVIEKEVNVPVYGTSRIRIADVGAFVMDIAENILTLKWRRIAQIGKTNAQNEPVTREQEAIKDIEQATGTHVEYYDYETKKRIR